MFERVNKLRLILLPIALLVWPSVSYADAHSHVIYEHNYSYANGTVSINVACSEDNTSCVVHSSFSNANIDDKNPQAGLLQEKDGIEDAIHQMQAMHISPQSLHTISKRITNPEERNLLALAAIHSKEWKDLMATFQTPKPEFQKLHPLFGKLLISSGAYTPLNEMLAKYGLKAKFSGVEKIANEHFSKLHIKAADVDSSDKTRVPVDGEITLSITQLIACPTH